MKYFAIILSMYMTLLAMLPCQDNDDVSAEITPVATLQNNRPAKEKADETCTPFCICACCSTVKKLADEVIAATPIQQLIEQVFAPAVTPAVQGLSIPFWQPPRLN